LTIGPLLGPAQRRLCADHRTLEHQSARACAPETTYRYWLLEPGGVQRRIELEPFKVVGRFTIAEQENGKVASEAFKGLE